MQSLKHKSILIGCFLIKGRILKLLNMIILLIVFFTPVL